MGRSSSKLCEIPNNPLQELQLEEKKREQRKRKQEKKQKQIAKLQKKHAKKHQKKNKKKKGCESAPTQRVSAAQGAGSVNSPSTSYEINKEELNRKIEHRIQTHLNGDLCTFLTNQIALTQQFFGNFESELTSISEELLAKENEFNQNLEEHSILLSTPLDAAVAKWLQYRPVHGPDKNNAQPLQPQALYVVFENIDIARPNDANYDSISPLCKVDMDTEFYKTTPCKDDYIDMLREIKWKGYVRLKLREDPKAHRSGYQSCSAEDVYTDGSSGYSTLSGYSLRAPSTTSSSGYGSEGDYDYAYIAHLNTHHPLSELKMNHPRDKCQLDAKVLPESCVSTLDNFIEPCHEEDTDEEHSSEEDEDEEDYYEDEQENGYSSHRLRGSTENYKDYETLQAIKLYKMEQERRRLLLQQSFLNSNEFMRYFGELVRQQLADRLHIAHEELERGTYRGSSIYTTNYELIPAIHVAQNAQHWPDCAFQFRIRERPISTNPLTGQQIQWPTRSMIRRIETFGFHVIPVGYAPKRRRNPFRELEWRIVFPKAERYLEQHLTSTQVKVFMMAKALVKTFIEPQEKNKALMFTVDHLRMHLFWECEQNFTGWPEEFLGEVLLRFIGSFMQRLREKCLRDFFIEERNLLESIPEYSLVTLYSILADIMANPLMHLMVALRNLEFAEDFFPKLNFKKVFENLAENSLVKLKMLAKNSRSLANLDKNEEEPRLMADEGAKGLVGMRQHREKTNGKLRRKTHLMRHNIEMKKKQDFEQKRRSVESIDLELFFTSNLNNPNSRLINQGVENLRRTNILEIILDHLLAMADKAVTLRSIQLAKVYLAQARRLCRFYHNYGCDVGAKEYLTSIHSINEDVNALHGNEEFAETPPALPMRTSVEPITCSQSKELAEKFDLLRRNVFVQVEPKVETIETSESNTARPSIKLKFGDRLMEECSDSTDDFTSDHTPSPGPRKSIKFTEHVVEVHEGDSNPIQKPEGHNPVSILRFNTSLTPADNVKGTDVVDDETAVDNQAQSHEKNQSIVVEKSQNTGVTTLESTFFSKFGTAAGILKNTPIGNLELMESLASSTEKIITTMSSEEKRVQICEMLRRKAIQLKGAFNQSSDS